MSNNQEFEVIQATPQIISQEQQQQKQQYPQFTSETQDGASANQYEQQDLNQQKKLKNLENEEEIQLYNSDSNILLENLLQFEQNKIQKIKKLKSRLLLGNQEQMEQPSQSDFENYSEQFLELTKKGFSNVNQTVHALKKFNGNIQKASKFIQNQQINKFNKVQSSIKQLLQNKVDIYQDLIEKIDSQNEISNDGLPEEKNNKKGRQQHLNNKLKNDNLAEIQPNLIEEKQYNVDQNYDKEKEDELSEEQKKINSFLNRKPQLDKQLDLEKQKINQAQKQQKLEAQKVKQEQKQEKKLEKQEKKQERQEKKQERQEKNGKNQNQKSGNDFLVNTWDYNNFTHLIVEGPALYTADESIENVVKLKNKAIGQKLVQHLVTDSLKIDLKCLKTVIFFKNAKTPLDLDIQLQQNSNNNNANNINIQSKSIIGDIDMKETVKQQVQSFNQLGINKDNIIVIGEGKKYKKMCQEEEKKVNIMDSIVFLNGVKNSLGQQRFQEIIQEYSK